MSEKSPFWQTTRIFLCDHVNLHGAAIKVIPKHFYNVPDIPHYSFIPQTDPDGFLCCLVRQADAFQYM